MTATTEGSALARAVHVEHCMGTVFTIDIRDAGTWDDAVHEVVTWLHDVDAVFSTYRAGSDISRMQRGELRVADAAPEVQQVIDLCAEIQHETDGFFSAVFGGNIDPTGLVKGWAIERASNILRAHGAANHAVNGGGDMQLAGQSAPGYPWRVGIADPQDHTQLVAVVPGSDLAVATSGTAERANHIFDPFTGRPSTAYASATILGPSLTRADCYATAAFVMGAKALRWVASKPGYELLLVAADGAVTTSSGWPSSDDASLR